jgi:hypothetical protein
MPRFSLIVVFCGLTISAMLTYPTQSPQVRAAGPEKKADQKQDKKENAPLAKYMRKKLNASNQILEGLVTEDMALVRKGAAQLEKMSKEEQFMVLNDAIYRQYSLDFQRSVQQLQKDAEKSSVDAASLTWIGTTLKCIECHKYTKGMLVSGP